MPTINGHAVKKVIVAGDAGRGGSAVLAIQLRRALARNRITVEHTPVTAIPADVDVVVCHRGVAERVRTGAPNTVVVAIQVFAGDPAISRLTTAIRTGGDIRG